MNEHHLQVADYRCESGCRGVDVSSCRPCGPREVTQGPGNGCRSCLASGDSSHFDGRNFADYLFVGEEEGMTEPPEFGSTRLNPMRPPCWVVDPLDGTVNYVHKLQSFAVSIGLFANGKMRLGVIYDPITEELFTAIDGAGAKCNDQPLGVSDCR